LKRGLVPLVPCPPMTRVPPCPFRGWRPVSPTPRPAWTAPDRRDARLNMAQGGGVQRGPRRPAFWRNRHRNIPVQNGSPGGREPVAYASVPLGSPVLTKQCHANDVALF